MRLAGRTALVTGGLRGIGLAIAERFAAEGARVVIGDLDPSDALAVGDALARIGAGARYQRLDIAEPEDWVAAEAALRDGGGRLDILVHNAGMALMTALADTSLEAWRRAMQINVDGVFLGMQRLAPLLEETGRARGHASSVVILSSIMGAVVAAQRAGYCTHKGALRQMSRALAIEFARGGQPIRVNALMPGFVETMMLQSSFAPRVEAGLAPDAERLARALAARVPMGRIARAEEIAAAALFLASDDSSYMTGAELVVDGGYMAE
jgi:NAD(P)-dependent dehydrogenase (short-subunit alcohol dehydrogenase family)